MPGIATASRCATKHRTTAILIMAECCQALSAKLFLHPLAPTCPNVIWTSFPVDMGETWVFEILAAKMHFHAQERLFLLKSSATTCGLRGAHRRKPQQIAGEVQGSSINNASVVRHKTIVAKNDCQLYVLPCLVAWRFPKKVQNRW